MPTYVKVTQEVLICGRWIELECEFSCWGGDEIEVYEGPFPVQAEMPELWRLEELIIENLDALQVFNLDKVYADAQAQAIDDAQDRACDREPGVSSFAYD